ncbi:hypothetical protein EK21DRAFT_15799, partial [Setomelanomma holmii]
VKQTLQLWAAHRLLMKGWQLCVPGSLQMMPIVDRNSLSYGSVPAPRVLQNQLDQILENYCARNEAQCLRELQAKMLSRQCSQVALYSVVAILLNIRERDIWRLLPWANGRNHNYKWRHPSPAATLIKQSVYSSNLLLCHL